MLLATLSLFWGLNWPAMKLALTEIEPWTFRALCVTAGSAGLLTLARLRGRRLGIPRGDRLPLFGAALLNVTVWQILSAFALTLMGAGRAAIVAYTMPLWASLLGLFVLGERPTSLRLAGLGLGLAGMAALLAPDWARLQASPWGAVLMIGASLSWAAGTVVQKKVRWQIDTMQLTGWQLALGGLPVLAGMLLFGRPASLAGLHAPAILGAAYALLIPMIYCQYAWFRVIALFPAGVAAIGTLAIPVIGVFSSAALIGEPIGGTELGALGLVTAALFLVLVLPAIKTDRG
ncbi:MAG TPA: DMT family transporter [Acetobacteraceae bacterium]